MLSINQVQELIKSEIEQTNFIKTPSNLYEPIEYTMEMGGKRIRPLLCLMATQLFNGDIQKALKPALGLEIFHNFTLLHDDIMDNADVRRNKPTVHKKWNENVGILSGDAMLINAYQYISQCESEILPNLLNLFNDVALGVCEGQQYDMDFEDRVDVTVDEYIEMIRLKTAILLAGSLKSGAILAKASEKDADLIYQFGINIGIAFQLQDDYLDSFGNQKSFGKRIGGDIIANKKTFLLITALNNATFEDKQTLKSWIDAKDFDEQEKIDSVKAIFIKNLVDKSSQKLMEEYYNLAMNNICQVNGNEKIKNELIDFAKNLMQRIN
ncbi:polyprenyl synthetase family protein [Plebeiibacterium sediminum]|uniref:Polyprenyl synthetase family protein n=1 Tax=Plebeiibacterium sediminum TaxID=2992112 RepID=A0AAE3SDL8_9BACT|nr:polyprenyl synthetase family protein [Plebeiobacterium sediminum]MCW3785146.1 polyprenyl synthetase family protein [Plebeiobacterium sediminum]